MDRVILWQESVPVAQDIMERNVKKPVDRDIMEWLVWMYVPVLGLMLKAVMLKLAGVYASLALEVMFLYV